MSAALARSPEALAAAAARAMVTSPRAARALGWMLLALFALGAAALVALPWQQTAVGSGRVVAYAPRERPQTIEAPVEGRLMHQRVREGERVREGDVLAEIVDNDPMLVQRMERERDAVRARLEAAEQRAASLEARLARVGDARASAVGAAGSRVRMAQERLAAAQQALAAAEAAADIARRNHARQEALARDGLAAARAAELAWMESVRAQTEVERARVTAIAARAEVEALSSDRGRASAEGLATLEDVRAARAQADIEVANAAAELARIEVRLARQSSQRVTAPRDGTVLRWIAGAGGELVKPGDALLSFVPDTDARAVELWVDGNDVPLLREGRHVRLQFEGWPSLQFSGWPSAAFGTFGGRVAVIDAADDGQGRFRALVVPDGAQAWPDARALRQGVRANGWVLLDRVRLGWELWRQFNGFPPSVTPAAPSARPSGGGAK